MNTNLVLCSHHRRFRSVQSILLRHWFQTAFYSIIFLYLYQLLYCKRSHGCPWWKYLPEWLWTNLSYYVRGPWGFLFVLRFCDVVSFWFYNLQRLLLRRCLITTFWVAKSIMFLISVMTLQSQTTLKPSLHHRTLPCMYLMSHSVDVFSSSM